MAARASVIGLVAAPVSEITTRARMAALSIGFSLRRRADARRTTSREMYHEREDPSRAFFEQHIGEFPRFRAARISGKHARQFHTDLIRALEDVCPYDDATVCICLL